MTTEYSSNRTADPLAPRPEAAEHALNRKTGWTLDMQGGPIYVQIAARAKEQLARGDLEPGDKLPSARDLAAHLRVNPNTVVHAYGQLERDGIVETKRGLGTFVREDAPILLLRDRELDEAARRFADEACRLGVEKSAAIDAIEEVWHVG